MYLKKLKKGWTMWCGKLASRERVFRGMWSRFFGNILTITKRMLKRGGNSELLRSRNASLCRVTAFNECSNTAGLIYIILDIGKVCLCTTNCHLYHKDPCPKGEMNYSKVVRVPRFLKFKQETLFRKMLYLCCEV